ncbi:unnamed protein product, partial [Meganyctiphanes norvegica]
MRMMAHLWRCLAGPRLYRVYHEYDDHESMAYDPNVVERVGNKIIQGLNIMVYVGLYTSPFIASYLYKRDYFSFAGVISIGNIATGLSILLMVGFLIRGFGRSFNPTYNKFLDILHQCEQSYNTKTMSLLRQYDFDFWAWPVDFSWADAEGDESKPRVYVDRSVGRSGLGWVITLPCQLAAWAAVHCFGRHLMYPGSIQLLQAAMDNYLQSGREKLVKEHSGLRNKITARDGNFIDTMFVDRRGSQTHPHGSTLVMCCEGNAGFYEMGIMVTPLDAGYSVLGWNHPGFSGSSGSPFPKQEQNAVDAVMQFAIHKLGFKPENIVVFAWSIGGYPGSWAAMNYLQIRGLILDATFDDVLPLAHPRMPSWMRGLVTTAIRQHLNLNVSDNVARYPGPITIVRRLRDEIICTQDQILRQTHLDFFICKISYVAYKPTQSLYTKRHLAALCSGPKGQSTSLLELGIDEDYYFTLLSTYAAEHSGAFPMMIGEEMTDDEKTKMLLFLASKYLVDMDSFHNNPLDTSLFRMPWTPIQDTSYVQVD